jgi:hypothetical protein
MTAELSIEYAIPASAVTARITLGWIP